MIRQLLLPLLTVLPAVAQFGSGPQSKLEAISSVNTIAAGDPFQVAVTLTNPEGYHSYYKNPGTAGKPLSIDWQLPESFTAGSIQFPIPHVFEIKQEGETSISYGYEGQVTHLINLTAPDDLASGQEITLKGSASWLICTNTSCFPQRKDFSIILKTGNASVENSAAATIITAAKTKLPGPAEGWEMTVEPDDVSIRLYIKPPSDLEIREPYYFFSADGLIVPTAEQEALPDSADPSRFDLYFDRAEGKKGHELSGIFRYHTVEGKEVGISIGPDSITEEKEKEKHTVAASEDERAEGAALYDSEAKPDYVLLSDYKLKSPGDSEAGTLPVYELERSDRDQSLLTTLGLVFVGGLLLNLMPCVFPVLGLKVMSFVSLAGEDESKIKKHGLIFGLGLLVTMWILAAFIMALNLNWGQQLSNPVFLGSIIIILFLMGLNLYGLFEFGTSMTSVGGDLQQKKGYSGSFFSGVLTTLIATPCSGPFLGVVMGIALSSPKEIAFLIFTVFALGIASPYILLAFFPDLIKKLPRPGAWMESFKQIMSFLVFATVIFFLNSYLGLVGSSAFTVFLFGLLLLAVGAYIYGRWGTAMTPARKRQIVGYGLAGAFAIGGIALGLNDAKKLEGGGVKVIQKVGNLSWQEWFPGKLELTRKKKRIAWIDYTADW